MKIKKLTLIDFYLPKAVLISKWARENAYFVVLIGSCRTSKVILVGGRFKTNCFNYNLQEMKEQTKRIVRHLEKFSDTVMRGISATKK